MMKWIAFVSGLPLMFATACAMTPAVPSGGEAGVEKPGAILSTKSGMLRGEELADALVFRGVPYARPPIGPLRWEAPQPIHWKGTRDATKFALPCAQPVPPEGMNGGGVAGETSEDCLYLNVWAPKNAKNAPVILWIHGGAGFLGAGSLSTYDGEAFARQGVIVVTINYRLGMLGQFAHPALTRAAGADAPLANYSMMDAVAALQWVRDNGEALGANIENVTVAGQSAGAVMVGALLSTPPSRGLFQKAIIQSAVPLLGGGRTLAQAEADGVRFADKLGLEGADATLDDLRALPVERVISDGPRGPGFSNGSYLVVDGRFRPVTTGQGYEAGTTVDVPLMVGSTEAEFFGPSVYSLAKAAQQHGRSPVWHYFFAYVPAWLRESQTKGPPHSAELPYMFNSLDKSPRINSRATEADHNVARLMNSCWVAFAKARSTERNLDCDGFRWPARSTSGDEIAVFGETPTIALARPIIEKNAVDFPMRPDIGEPQ